MTLRLYNTLSRRVEDVTPHTPGRVTMYVCGPTVYDEPHIGHARSAYLFDVMRRYLARTYDVTFVRNVTDVDDKIIERARAEGESPTRIAEKYLAAYHRTMDALGIERPTQEPRATEHIEAMIELISRLVAKGMAYEAQGNVYFDVRKFPSYGQLSHQQLDAMQAGARVEPEPGKRLPLDFTLWKAAKPDEPSWPSPWGPGRPGWHIECSAMSMACLKTETLDIHGGGMDLIFPHHQNEIAQSEAATGKSPFAKYWLHHGLLTINGQKMSKSLGNVVTVDHVLERYPHPDYLKLFFLKTHYRSPIDYSDERMDEAKKNMEEFGSCFQHYDQLTGDVQPSGGTDTQRFEILQKKTMFEEAMDEDLNTPKALAVLFDLVNLGKRIMESQATMKLFMARWAHDVLIECGTVLGLFTAGFSEENQQTLTEIQKKIAERDEARKQKKFVKADEIRQELHLQGVLLTDTPHGTLWRRKR